MRGLLLDPQATLTTLVPVSFAVLLALALVYGALRTFIKTSWLGWQIAILFFAVFLAGLVPEDADGLVRIAAAGGIALGSIAVVLGGGSLVRFLILRRQRRAHPFFRVMNHLLGALTAVVNVAVFLAVFAAAGLGVCYYCMEPPAALGEVFALPVWTEFLAAHAYDLVLIAFLALAARCGYRVGLGRAVFIVLMIVFTFGAVVLSGYLVLFVPFFSSMAKGMAGWFGGMHPAVSTVLGYALLFLFVFLVLFVVIGLLGIPLNFCVRKCRYVLVLGVIDGAILGLVFFLFGFALVAGGHALAFVLESGMFAESLPEAVGGFVSALGQAGNGMAALFRSAPLSRCLYDGVAALFGR